ncbi:osmoprotectant transport system permease protein [Microbacterium terrae]|uniref:Glycine betaine/carnitine/choline transport system permease protein OpuCB n=1 Tax=Microbacterium terrae TaxID=69369 RepID=A0A0M2GW04_9MICO|nr:ABC transporter permease subunit [Microbacterium terrae]KJL37702.1 Glycine betaine/carnitine/choline transport system permease protein OpuCB [Microbacterium terrae]MBP1076534.1 osmoprotectant transport system permease protein [Microbacterium terrae]GLJ97363.1 glycine/betaine ABC transporter permease [Microbacterium terrae]
MTWVLDNLDLIGALTVAHLRQSLIAIVLGFALAIPLGWLAFRYTGLRGPMLTTVGLLYTIPSLGLFPLITTLFGVPLLSETNLIIALTIYAVAIMTRAVTDALASTDPAVRQAAAAVGFGAWKRFWRVEFPLSGPVTLAGLRVAAVSTISLATVGILIGVENLGYLFTNGSQRRIIPEVLAGVVAVVVVALVIDLFLVLLGRVLMPWTRATTGPAPAAKTVGAAA